MVLESLSPSGAAEDSEVKFFCFQTPKPSQFRPHATVMSGGGSRKPGSTFLFKCAPFPIPFSSKPHPLAIQTGDKGHLECSGGRRDGKKLVGFRGCSGSDVGLREKEEPRTPPWFLASAARSWALSLLQGRWWGVVWCRFEDGYQGSSSVRIGLRWL